MQLVKEGKYTEISGELPLSELYDFLNFMINYYQSTFLTIDDWLTKQERRFFIASVIIANRGIKYTSSEAKSIFRNVFNLRRQSDVRGHLKRLEEKNWLRSSKRTKKITLVEFFNFDLTQQVFKIDVTLSFKNGKVI